MKSLERFAPDQYVDPNSIYRSQSRLAVFVVSTHVAGKPSANTESFLQWLRDAPMTVNTSALPGETQESDVAAICTPPNISSPTTKSYSPREYRINSPKPEGLHRHHSLSDALRASFHVNWRHPFGGGESSMNIKQNGPLLGVQYAVFGVGNSIYRTYNATAKYIDTRLQELGGVRVCPLGLGDVSKDIENVFTKWESQLLQVVSNQPNGNGDMVSAPNTARAPSPTKLAIRMSLPSATASDGIKVEEMLTGQPTMICPTPSDLKKLPQVEIPGRGRSKAYQRRYSSATTMLYARHASPEPKSAMPPLTDRS
ncbi:hypothetical protein PF010_g12753 [Phytophthora fragariae]|uniref:Flavodoxin-like domain-containing protein n=1 Tax=Phytophthora fragariae TaxID=53985 RepID=A0A6G0L1V4_9STRA|nr:hypothetical protein PF010_g12753 [Phytophthora fragariae]